MLVPWAALNRRHPTTTLCVREAEWKHQWMEEEEAWEGDKFEFRVCGQTLAMVNYF